LSTSLDTNWDPDEKWMGEVEKILPFIDVLLPNQNEVLALGGSQDLELAIDRLADIVPTLAVKLGERGSLVRTRGEEIRLPARNVRVVDTVGAGDSFDAGFIYGWLSGRGPRRCLEIANACGGLSTEAAGGTAAQPTGSRLAEFLGGAP
jgi:sugar/nucleoside kinase (ribokinase family)